MASVQPYPREADEPLHEPTEPLVFPSSAAPAASVVVSVSGPSGAAYSCLRSVAEGLAGVAYELIVGDDRAGGRGDWNLESVVENAQWIVDSERRGHAGNMNNAARFASAPFLVFLQDDVRLRPRSVEAMIETLVSDPSIGMVAPRLIASDGRIGEAGRIIWRDGSFTGYGAGEDARRSEFGYVKEVDCASMTCFAIRAELWESIGGFDHHCAPAHMDADLSFAVRAAGHRVVYQPRAEVERRGGPAPRPDEVEDGEHLQGGIEAFRSKWAEPLAAQREPGRHAFLARDRSAAQSTALVLAAEVPRRGRGPEGRAAFDRLEQLAEAGVRLLLLAEDGERPQPDTAALEQLGIEVVDPSFDGGTAEWLRRWGPYLGHVVFSGAAADPELIDEARRHAPLGRRVCLVQRLEHLSELERFHATGSLEALDLATRMRGRELGVLGHMDSIHVAGPREEQALRGAASGAELHRLPPGVRLPEQAEGPSAGERPDLLLVGDFSQPHARDALAWFAGDVLPELRERLPAARVVAAGSGLDGSADAAEGMVAAGPLGTSELAAVYARARVALAPVLYRAGPSDAIVEALAHGVPVVTTPVAVADLPELEGAVAVGEGGPGFAARVVDLYEDTGGFDELAGRARAVAAEHFSAAGARAALAADFGTG